MWVEGSIPLKLQCTGGCNRRFFRNSNTRNSTDMTLMKQNDVSSDGYFHEWTTEGEGGRVSSIHLVSMGHHQSPPTLTLRVYVCVCVCVSQHVFPIWFHPFPQHLSSFWPLSIIFLISFSFILLLFFSLVANKWSAILYFSLYRPIDLIRYLCSSF